ncbi:MAG: hypothetical protein E6J43_05230 [Chloroflexi bacterium]|nr:MAG: hypothetical protein E6J43_05230 [Chloroflexota bacterium]
MPEVMYDNRGQYEQLQPWILPDETLHAVFDCKGWQTGFLGITDKRLLFYNKEFMRKRKALVSVPFNKITSVGSIDEGRGALGWGSHSLLVVRAGAGEDYEFEFRGGDKAQRAYQLIMSETLQNEP